MYAPLIRRYPGLSPRVRGNRLLAPLRDVLPGSIPACAGEPAPAPPLPAAPPVYPRVCGGTVSAYPLRSPVQGLSPRVRGNQVSGPLRNVGVRSIPACAGEPTAALAVHVLQRVYPRVCGGNPEGGPLQVPPRGSIPACAGEPRDPPPSPTPPQVYPRVCGGTATCCTRSRRKSGLSPRVRGNLLALSAPVPQCGSIPACAGEPRLPLAGSQMAAVYPRVCGGTAAAG